ncbi:sensor domain-containing protein [Vibrio anguillarum]|uniref:sensor domain-containing protein n=1 Tax=Vibrio anguillarum TaxID=55601 RepID=UPI002FE4AE9F
MMNKEPNNLLPSLQEFLDSLDEHVWLKDLNGVYVLCNKAVEQAWNKKKSHIVGSTDEQLFGAELAQKFIEADQWVVDQKRPLVTDRCSQLTSNEQQHWYETSKSPVYSTDGHTLLGVLGMTRDISRYRQLENQLNLTTQIFNHSREGVVITDAQANIISVNVAFSVITGYQAEEVLGNNPRILQSGYHDASFYQQIWQTIRDKKPWKGEFVNRRKNGSLYPQLSTITPVFDNELEVVNYICVFEDISLRREHEETIKQLAHFDVLTTLPNRTTALREMAVQIKHSQKIGESFAILFLDIDHFKHINDSFGHYSGDQALIEIANRLKTCLTDTDHLARIGSDEFVILLTHLAQDRHLSPIISKIFSIFEQHIVLGEESLRLSTSIGVAIYPQDGETPEALLKNADTAMYQAKKNGRNGYAFYSPELTDIALTQIRLQSALYQALEHDQFYLVYQPQFELSSNKLLGFEALIRWQHPQLGQISPAEFIPIAEKSGLITSIGEWVLRTACEQGKKWFDDGYHIDTLAINISTIQLKQANFLSKLKAILAHSQFPACKLELEITEGFLIENQQKAIHDLQKIVEQGIRIALDDFGTGYSSLSYLKGLPLQKLKIDRSFIHDIPDNSESNAIVAAVVAMGKSLSLNITAEGIEDEQQRHYLNSIGCQFGQGYYLGRPVGVKEATELLKQHQNP